MLINLVFIVLCNISTDYNEYASGVFFKRGNQFSTTADKENKSEVTTPFVDSTENIHQSKNIYVQESGSTDQAVSMYPSTLAPVQGGIHYSFCRI